MGFIRQRKREWLPERVERVLLTGRETPVKERDIGESGERGQKYLLGEVDNKGG